ncbi:MAG: hypothetical protein M1315_03115 [Candidatus Thermoplasmatota archaeon]|nr:hypothetical protein [Candidatus Thermoplasmatota archaeon]
MANEKDDELLTLPEFNEREFIETEKDRAKLIVIMFLIGAALGLFSGYLETIHLWYFSILAFFGVILFLRQILRALNIKIPKIGSHRFYMVMELLLTWIVFWIIFLNPPITVASGPQVSSLEVHTSSGWEIVNSTGTNVFAWYVGDVSYRANITYLYPITSVSMNQLIYSGPPSSTDLEHTATSTPVHFTSSNMLYFNLTYLPTAGQYWEGEIIMQSHGTTTEYIFYLSLPSS